MYKRHIPSLWSGQWFHFMALAVLLISIWYLWDKIGRPFPFLFWLTISFAIVHQVFVWIAWRFELKSQTISKNIGFKTYLIIFFILFIGRFIALLLLIQVDYGSLLLDNPIRIILSVIILIPAVYTLYSVKKYFGLKRAAGADHFEKIYQKMPLIKKGMFKYSSNSMYVFGFLIFWGLAIAFASKAALLASAFSHAYIWVHYYATEKPDMDYLYYANN